MSTKNLWKSLNFDKNYIYDIILTKTKEEIKEDKTNEISTVKKIVERLNLKYMGCIKYSKIKYKGSSRKRWRICSTNKFVHFFLLPNIKTKYSSKN